MTLSYTPRLKLAVPDFLTEPWHSEFAQAMYSIDQTIFNAIMAGAVALWTTAHVYSIGDVVVSPDNGALYTCAVAHTSGNTTLTDDITANPTFWVAFAPSLASQAEAEAGVENSKYMSALRTKQAIAALSSATTTETPRSGLLQRVSNTQLSFTPKNGDRIKINGILYAIPAAGIAGLTNTAVFVNGVAGQSLVANTAYLVFAFINSGVVTADFRTGATHQPSASPGNVGVEILTGDDSRTLIGIVRTSSTNFIDSASQRFTRSWFNAPSAPMLNPFTSTSSALYKNITVAFNEVPSAPRIEWVNFAGEAVLLQFLGSVYASNSTSVTSQITLGLDSTTVAQDCMSYLNIPAGNQAWPQPCSVPLQPSEGYHFGTIIASSGGPTNPTNVYVPINSPGNRPTFQGVISARG